MIFRNAAYKINTSTMSETAFQYNYDDKMSSSVLFVLDFDIKPYTFKHCFLYRESFHEQRDYWGTPYKFNAKELDNETGMYYYGARYYTPELSIWLSVDPLSDNAPGWSPYRYGFNNPVRFTDPNGLFESESDAKQWAKNNGIKTGFFGNHKIRQESDGSWAINNRREGVSHFRDNSGVEGYMAGRGEDGVITATGAFSDRNVSEKHLETMANPSVQAVHGAQNDFIRGSAELSAHTLNITGTAAQTVGTGLMAVPGGQALGGALIGGGNILSGVGTGISMSLNAKDGEWGKFINNGASLGLSYGVYRGLNNINITSNQKKFLRGFSDVQISVFSGVINYGIEKKNNK